MSSLRSDRAAGPEPRAAVTSPQHYNEEYFKWQQPAAKFGGWANLTKFQHYVQPEFNVIDFGCGPGYLLQNLKCKGKIGIEINPASRAEAARNGIEVHANSSSVPDDWADLIVSDNALEHCLYPLEEVEGLTKKVKRGGHLVFVVPCETIHRKYAPNDINQHLYSWSPLAAGNFFNQAGLVVQESRAYFHKWPPGYEYVARFGGRPIFELASRISGQLRRSWFQVRVVAQRP